MSEVDIARLRGLKTNILTKNLDNSLIVFECSDNYFIASQYVEEIIKIRNIKYEYADSNIPLDSIISSTRDSLFDADEDKLIIYCNDEFTTSLTAKDLTNVIVLCKKNSSQLDADYIYKFSKLEDWQVIDYINAKCSGLSKDECTWLFNNIKSTSKNEDYLYRIENEISKLSCFSKGEQSQVFHKLSQSGGYQDLSIYSIFNLTNAITKRDKLSVLNILSELDGIDVDAFGLLSILHKNFKQVIDIQLGKNATPESLKMSQKQFNAIKYNCGKYTQQELIDRFKFITSIDSKIKNGLLDLNQQQLIYYIICSVV